MPKTLLLADDSVTIQKVVGISFANEDIALVTVDNGDDALARARELQPDIVLADVVMPGMNGYEVCEAIKADAALCNTPVLLLTGTFEAFDEGRANQAGADGHITKPFEAQALVDEVNRRLAALTPPASAAAAPEAPETVAAEDFDFFEDETTEPSSVAASAAPEPHPGATTVLMDSTSAGASAFGETPDLGREAAASDAFGFDAGIPSDDALGPDAGLAADDSLGLDAGPAADDSLGLDPAPDEPADGAFGFEAPDAVYAELAIPASKQLPEEPQPTIQSAEPMTFESPELGESFANAQTAPSSEDLGAVDPTAPTRTADADATRVVFAAPEQDVTAVASGDLPEGGGTLGHESPAVEGFALGHDSLADVSMGDLGGESLLDPSGARDYDVSSSDLGDALAAGPDRAPAPAPAPEVAATTPFAVEPPLVDAQPEVEEAPGAAFSPTSGSEPLPPSAAPTGDEGLFGSPVETPEPPAPSLGASEARDLAPALHGQLHDTLEKIAWEAFGDVAERLVKDALVRVEQIAWEVIPQLAEALIQEEIRKLKNEE